MLQSLLCPLGNTAQFPPDGLSTAPAAAAPRLPYRHLELCGIALSFSKPESSPPPAPAATAKPDSSGTASASPRPTANKFNVTVKTDENGTAFASPAKAAAGTEIALTAKKKQLVSGNRVEYIR